MHRRDEEGFLAEIQEHPDDDTPRLIYADWLEERGDARAEFIRVQCASARRASAGERSGEREVRETELLKERRTECLAELGKFGVKDVRFARGFIEKVHCEGAQFLDHPRSLFQHAPALRGMILRTPLRPGSGLLQRILNSRYLGCLTTLDLSHNQLRTLVGSGGALDESRPVRLAVLNLAYNQLSGRGIDELLENRYLAGVTTLNLSGNGLTIHDAKLLARSPSVTALKSLCLDENLIGDDGLRFLSNSPHLAELTLLSVQKNELTAAGVRGVANSAQPAHLTSLNLSHNSLGQVGAAVLASASNLARLSALELVHCDIGPEGARSLAGSLYLRKVTTLDLSANEIQEGAEALAQSRNLPALANLNLANNGIKVASARVIAAAPEFKRLASLDLRGNPLNGCAFLIEAFGEERLRL